MLQLLVAHVRRDAGKLADADRPKVIALLPADAPPPRVAVAVRDPRARALETLDQARRVVDGGKLEEEMHMVAHDPDLHDSRTVPFRFGEQERTEEVRDPFIDER